MWFWNLFFANWSDAARFSTGATVSPSLLGRPHTTTRVCSQNFLYIAQTMLPTLHTRFFVCAGLSCSTYVVPSFSHGKNVSVCFHHMFKSPYKHQNFPAIPCCLWTNYWWRNADQGPNGMCKKKTFGCKKLLGALAEPSEILEGERSDTDTGLLWTDAMQTLDSCMRGLGFFCQILPQKNGGVEEPHQGEGVFWNPNSWRRYCKI